MITPFHPARRFPSLTFRLSPRLAACALLVCGIAPSPAEVSGPVPPVNFSPSEDYAKREINYQGVPSIARSPSGRLWAVWYAGPKGEDIYNYLLAATSDDDGKTWSEIKFLIDPDGDGPLRACNPVFWTDPDGTLWLFWCQFPESKTTESLVYAMSTSNPDDENPTWTEPRAIFQGVTQNKPIVNHQGDWLLPVAIWYGPDSIRVAVSSDRGETWSLRGTANVPKDEDRNCDEPMIVEVGTDLLMLVRTKYGIGRSTSTDGGRTWEPVTPTTLPHTPARLYLSKLNSGNLLLVKHGPLEGKPVGRRELTAYLSKDGGTTWEGGLLLDERVGVSYPDGTQSDDGTIYLIYDHDRYGEREVLFATFTEEDILAKKPVSDKFRTKQLINKAPGVAKGRPQANNREQPAPTPAPVAAPTVQPGLRTWTGLGNGANWRIKENWDDGLSLPAPGSSLLFTGTTRLKNNNNTPEFAVRSIHFDESSGEFAISSMGHPLLLEKGIYHVGEVPQIVKADIVLADDIELETAKGELVVSGVISGSFGLTKKGAGSIMLSANNTYTGPTTVAEGVLLLGKPSLPDTATVRIADGAVLQLDFEGTDRVGAFEVNDQPKPPGVYGALQSGADQKTPALQGTGLLEVGS